MKKIFEAKDEQANQKLDDALKIAQRAENLQNSLTSPYYNFADDIKFEDARLMAAKGDGQGLCYWFNCLGHKFGSWLHKAEYFVKTFWKKTPDEIINVGEDMKKNYCKNLGEYIEKGMKTKTINQIKETKEIKEEITQVRKKAEVVMMAGNGNLLKMKKSILINLIITLSTIVAVAFYFISGPDSLGATRIQCLKYFTTLSNILLAVAAFFLHLLLH